MWFRIHRRAGYVYDMGMARPPSTGGGRPVVVSLRLSMEEAAHLDEERGPMSRTAYLRHLVMEDAHEKQTDPVRSSAGDPTPHPPRQPEPSDAGHRHRPPPEGPEKWLDRGQIRTRYTCACGAVVSH
jgi:hypothetical protein